MHRTSAARAQPIRQTGPIGTIQRIQRAAGNMAASRLLSDRGLSSYVSAARGAGQPLPASIRSRFEPRFGADFTGVRVHTDRRAAAAAADINATAFTYGSDIHFGAGRFQPGTPGGDRLLAHELTHVVQQGAGGASPSAAAPTVQRTIGDGHDLTSLRFKGDLDLEGCFDDETRLTMNGIGKPGTKKVESGPAVQKVQDALVELGLLKAESATGSYNRATWDAVKKLKKDNALGFETLGDVGPGTMAFLDRKFAPAPTPTCPACPDPSPRPPGCPPCAVPPPTPVTKPGSRTPCERSCEFNMQECLAQSPSLSGNPLACLAQRSACLAACGNARPAFEVCARLLQPPVEISGCNHAYVETPTRRYAIITPCTLKESFALPGGGVALKTDVSPDPCGRRPVCVECRPKPGVTDLEACFEAQFRAYPGPSVHKLFGPNSNTFAGTLGRACCDNMTPKPAAFGCLPGWDDPPAAAASAPCPSGPPVC